MKVITNQLRAYLDAREAAADVSFVFFTVSGAGFSLPVEGSLLRFKEFDWWNFLRVFVASCC